MKHAILSVAGLAAVVLAGAARADSPAVILHGPHATAEAVVEAERAWSARFGEIGIAKGMREFLDAKDGLAFVGGDPVKASAAFAAFGGDTPSHLKLSWVPAEVFAAEAGDMAASWGRYTITPDDPAKKPQTGRYVTVWRKTDDGQWKAIMDIGSPDTP